MATAKVKRAPRQVWIVYGDSESFAYEDGEAFAFATQAEAEKCKRENAERAGKDDVHVSGPYFLAERVGNE